MRRCGFTLLQLIAVIALVMVLAATLFPIFSRPQENINRANCPSNLKQISLGLLQYQQDYDETWAPASNGRAFSPNMPYGWADAIQPYTKSLLIMQCPLEPTKAQQNPDPTQVGYTDYWYNTNCSAQKAKSFTSVMNTILLGDGAIGGGDARYSVTREVLTTEDTSRHIAGNNFAFADGHVKWLKPGKVSAVSSPKDGYSFNIR